jgi:disulfide bond formation protein DsbB
MKAFDFILKLPYSVFNIALALVAFVSLTAALISQYIFGLHPCELCIYQRVPFVVVILLGLIGFFKPIFARITLWISSLALLINSGIAFFHSGVERKWWAGLSGCTSPDMGGSIEELIARIESTAVTRCDEISWSLFGLSMANYNVLLCGGLAILIVLILKLKRA